MRFSTTTNPPPPPHNPDATFVSQPVVYNVTRMMAHPAAPNIPRNTIYIQQFIWQYA